MDPVSDPALPPETLAWLLATARLWAVFRVHPVWRMAVGPWWNLVAAGLAGIVALAAVAAGATAPHAQGSIEIATWVGLELVTGTALGLLVSLPGYALVGAATSAAVVLRTQTAPLLALSTALVLATALSLGLHRPLIAAAADTFVHIPLGTTGVASVSRATLWSAAHTTMLLALALATPAWLAGVVFEVAARLVGRGPGPAHGAAAVAPWFRLAAAMVALGASWSAYAPSWTTALLPP